MTSSGGIQHLEKLTDNDLQHAPQKCNTSPLLADLPDILQRIPQEDGKIQQTLDSIVWDATGMAARALENEIQGFDKRLHELESESLQQHQESCTSILRLHTDIRHCLALLSTMDNDLDDLQCKVQDVNSTIQQVLDTSSCFQRQIQSHGLAQEIVSTYVDQLLATPELIRAITEEPIRPEYKEHLMHVEKKLCHASQPGLADHPAAQSSVPELMKLKFKGVVRVRDFLYNTIADFAKTNIQEKQTMLMEKHCHLFSFLSVAHPQSAYQLREHYVSTMSHVYLRHFTAYRRSLGGPVPARGKGPYTPKKVFPLLGTEGVSSNLSTFGGSQLASGHDGISVPPSAHHRLARLDSDPMIPRRATDPESMQEQYSEIFRSTLKLLCDTSTFEILFLTYFFAGMQSSTGDDAPSLATRTALTSTEEVAAAAANLSTMPLPASVLETNPELLFKKIMKDVLAFLHADLLSYAQSCQDPQELLFMLRAIEFHRGNIHIRGLNCLDAPLEKFETTIFACLKRVLDAHMRSLKSVDAKRTMASVSGSVVIQPLFVLHRAASLLASMWLLVSTVSPQQSASVHTAATAEHSGSSLESQPEKPDSALAALSAVPQTQALHSVTISLNSLAIVLDGLLQRLAVQVKEGDVQKLFLVNNLDRILHIFSHILPGKVSLEKSAFECITELPEKELDCLFCSPAIGGVARRMFTQLSTVISDHVEQTLKKKNLADLVEIVVTAESEDDMIKETLSVERLRRVAQRLENNWETILHDIYTSVLASFTSYPMTVHVLQKIFTKFLLYVTQFHSVVRKVTSTSNENVEWTRHLTPTHRMIQKIKEYANSNVVISE